MVIGTSFVLYFDVGKKNDRYRVTVAGPLGAAEHEIKSDLAAWLGNLSAAAAGDRDHGQRLHEALIGGQVRSCFNLHRMRAQKEGKLLRLVFRAAEELETNHWPIESLRDAASAEDLSLAAKVTVTRSSARWTDSRIAVLQPPLNILVVLPEPGDAQPFGAQAFWEALASSTQPLVSKGQARITRLPVATERALEERLQAEPWHVVHFVGQGSSRPAARYGTLNFEGADRRTRAINAQSFARVCEKCPALGLVMLQATLQAAPRQAFEVTTNTLLDSGLLGVVWLPDFAQPQVSAFFAGEFYGALGSGQPVDEAVALGRRALASISGETRAGTSRGMDLRYWAGPVLFASEPALADLDSAASTAGVAAAKQQQAPTEAKVTPRAEVPANAAVPDTQPASPRRTLEQQESERKRAAGEFDVFLCHNIADKAMVKEIGRQLMDRGILPWLDEWELRPGIPWQNLLEEEISKIKAAAVFVGGEGIGPWQRQELDGFLRQFAQRHCPVIPVLLPGAPGEPRLPMFLTGMTWVDFRITNPDPMERLVWGITGQRPEIT